MTPERARLISFRNEVPEDAHVGRVLGRSFADALTETVAEREPVGGLDGFEFTVRIELLLRHVVEKIGEPRRLCTSTRRKNGPDTRGFVLGSGNDELPIRAKSCAMDLPLMSLQRGDKLAVS